MTTYRELADQLETVESFADLEAYAAAVCDSGLCDESEQTTQIGYLGPLAAWSTPPGLTVTDDNGEDFTVILPSGERARWINTRRAWELQ